VAPDLGSGGRVHPRTTSRTAVILRQGILHAQRDPGESDLARETRLLGREAV